VSFCVGVTRFIERRQARPGSGSRRIGVVHRRCRRTVGIATSCARRADRSCRAGDRRCRDGSLLTVDRLDVRTAIQCREVEVLCAGINAKSGRRQRKALSRGLGDGCSPLDTRFSSGQTYRGTVRTAYHEQLDALTEQLGQMCGLAGVAMERATQALLQADLLLAEQVIIDHDQITASSAQATEKAFVLLALQAPVAGDLRAIIGSIQIAANIDRMGALALHVAKIARRRHPQHALPEQVNGYFAEMGRVAVELGNAAQEVLLTCDPDKAARIDEEDDAMDDLHRRLFSVLMDHEWKHGVAAAVDVTLLGRFYERFADHAVEVARRVIFQATGKFSAGKRPTTSH
jgi:phosphate transport system protein